MSEVKQSELFLDLHSNACPVEIYLSFNYRSLYKAASQAESEKGLLSADEIEVSGRALDLPLAKFSELMKDNASYYSEPKITIMIKLFLL